MRIREVETKIGDALRTVKVIDPHVHLNAAKPAAANVADVVLYHHVWIELVSSGMGQYEVTKAGLPHELVDPGMDPLERVKRLLPYLPNIRNTTVGTLLRWLLSDVYGFHGNLDAANVEGLAAEVERRGSDPAWPERLFSEVCGIEQSVTVEAWAGKRFERIRGADERFRLLNLADGKVSLSERLGQMESILGREVRTSSDYQDFIARLVADPSRASAVFIGAWMPACFTQELADDENVTRIFERAREGKPLSRPELGSVSYYGMVHALAELRKTSIRTIQLIVGSEVLPPHRALTEWCGTFSGAVARLASQFEDFRFNLSMASDMYIQDTAILAKHFPNISVAGYWWHTMYPYYIRKAMETRLDIVPASKIVAFFSDAYHAEWCWPKLRMVKQIIEEILVERVAKGWYDMDTALSIIPTIFYDAPKAIYGLAEVARQSGATS
jgi:glucuronate isomerase